MASVWFRFPSRMRGSFLPGTQLAYVAGRSRHCEKGTDGSSSVHVYISSLPLCCFFSFLFLFSSLFFSPYYPIRLDLLPISCRLTWVFFFWFLSRVVSVSRPLRFRFRVVLQSNLLAVLLHVICASTGPSTTDQDIACIDTLAIHFFDRFRSCCPIPR